MKSFTSKDKICRHDKPFKACLLCTMEEIEKIIGHWERTIQSAVLLRLPKAKRRIK